MFDLKSGRAKTLSDSMVEDIINTAAQGSAQFPTKYDEARKVLWFQLTPAHTYWLTSRRRQGRGALERDAIRSQLREAPYSIPSQMIENVWMYGVDLNKAVETGLDVPEAFSDRSFTVRF